LHDNSPFVILAAVYASNKPRTRAKKRGEYVELHVSRQLGFFKETRGFPSLPYDRFGFS